MKIEILHKRISKAIAYFWDTRHKQSEKQAVSGNADHGDRSAVTGGAQMDGFMELITGLLLEAGADKADIYYDKNLELPGFFRPTKKWDLLLVKNKQLILAIEAKSHVGPSFSNNFNNRTEEAMGSALDLWTAYRNGAYNNSVNPWLGYIILLEDCPESRAPVKVHEPHFKIFPEFEKSSYAKRYELFCRKLIRERQYNAASFIMSDREGGKSGKYSEPAPDLSFKLFIRSLYAHAKAYFAAGNK